MQAMELALKAAGAEAATTVFCDDGTRNVSGGHAAGMFSVLVCAHPSEWTHFPGSLCQLLFIKDACWGPLWRASVQCASVQKYEAHSGSTRTHVKLVS